MENKNNKTNKIESQNNTLMNNLTVSKSFFLNRQLIIGLALVILLGIGTGYIFRQKGSSDSVGSISPKTSSQEKEVVGSKDTKTFRDIAEGKLETGGIEGEGAYHLVRPGGKSQYVYLTSSVVDLAPYIGKKIKVWGETQKAQYAGWLMDVGRVEVLK